MKITIESTSRIVEASGIQYRVWRGQTERGVKVQVLVPRIAVLNTDDRSQFEAELLERHAPSQGPQAFTLRMVL